MRSIPVATASAAFLAFLIAGPADSAVAYKHQLQNPATACTLSIPTTDTKVRPKATGFRNEGTANVYVICGFDRDSPSDGGPYNGFVDMGLGFAGFDGKSRQFSCTLASTLGPLSTPYYLTKQVSTGEFGGTVEYSYSEDGGGADYYFGDYASQSITCILPPGVSIISVDSDVADLDGTPMACSNGKDDDGDGLADEKDPGCIFNGAYEPYDNNETNNPSGAFECSDGIDNDGDGRIDAGATGVGDPQCTGADDMGELRMNR